MAMATTPNREKSPLAGEGFSKGEIQEGSPPASTANDNSRVMSVATLQRIESEYIRFPINATTRLVQEILGGNVVVLELTSKDNMIRAELKNRITEKHLPAHIVVPIDWWNNPRSAKKNDTDVMQRRLNSSYLLTIKVSCGIFAFASGREIELDIGGLMDVLGYRRDSRGWHQTSNYRRVNDALTLLEGLYVPIYKRGKKGKRILDSHEPFLQRTSVPATHLTKTHYRIGGDIGKRYGWIGRKWLAEYAYKHPLAVMLYPYLVWQWEMGWNQHQGTFKRNVPAVLRDIGVRWDQKHFTRTVKTLERELEHMQKQGYVQRFSFKNASNGRRLLVVEAPKEHPSRTLRGGFEK